MSKGADVLVVGGGAAGIIAARQAADSGARVTLLEKNASLGMKILISGGGKCNLTHDGPMEEIRRQFRQGEALFLKPSFHKFSNQDFLRILHGRGMRTYVRPDGRIFPVEPANAKDVVRILTEYVQDGGITLRTGCAVTGINVTDGRISGVEIDSGPMPGSRVILCTGGSSYPATGTTGDGWRWLREHGHTIVPLRAALAPIYFEEPRTDWSGVALRDVVLKSRSAGGKEICRWAGDVLFTHKGVSGPAALGISRDTVDHIASGNPAPTIEVDLRPGLSFEQLQHNLRQLAAAGPRKTAPALVQEYVPARLVEPLLLSAGLELDLRLSNLPTKSLNKLIEAIKGWRLGIVRTIPLERGEVVAGGVSLSEVDPQTMKSRVIPGLYLCGEVLDIAGPVGGYNLQAAWSTGYVAGISAATP